MRSLHLLALAAVLTVAGAACGDNGNGGNGPSNEDPVADFTFACTLLTCNFTDASTDDGDIASWSWDFGDGASSNTADPTHTYTAAGTYTVTLTVTDNEGADDDVTKQVVVSTEPVNQPPTAAFTFSCSSRECSFTSTSTDADGTIATYAWDFGDGATSTEQNPTHTYDVDALTAFTVTLTVTDDDGAASTPATQEITVAPSATLTCNGTPNCSLLIEVPSTVVVTLVSSECELSGNQFRITAPAELAQTLFEDGCNTPDGTQVPLNNGEVIGASTEIRAEVISGGGNLALPPALRVTGSFAEGWTLEFDDGAIGPDTDPNEPDFNDLIITIVATPQ